ncbi:MAG: divergent PAP2 family protein [Clostridiales bacterium]|nr:divergent PAP2 family protein [Clostridiales bacterium]
MPLGNRILVLSALSWALAQIAKGFIQRITEGYFSRSKFLESGGMPSSHSALVTCCATTTGLLYGFDSGLFAIACLFAIVTMYDATHVRRSSGEQAKVLNELLKNIPEEMGPNLIHQELKVVMGHTVLQVFFGALLGFCVGIIGVELFH